MRKCIRKEDKKHRYKLFLKSTPALILVFFVSILIPGCILKPEVKIEAPSSLYLKIPQITVLSQNTMLIPFGPAAPAYVERTGILEGLLPEGGIDIAGLQEVFAGKSQDSILKAWHIAALPGAIGLWQPITGAEEVSELAVSKNSFDIKIIDAKPNQKPAKISFGPYYVLGPDTASNNIFRQDSGLLILSRLPVIAASAFSFSDAQGFDRLANKGVVYARIKTGPQDNDYIHFFNTHLQSHDHSTSRFKNLSELLIFVSNIIMDDLKVPSEPPGDCVAGLSHKSRNTGINPIIIVGDFNIKACRPDGWVKKADIASGPSGSEIQDFGAYTSADYIEFMNYLKSFAEDNLGMAVHGQENTGCLPYLEDLWQKFYPDEPGFTWMGKDWKTGAMNPYGEDGNQYATEKGPPERIDYILLFRGSTAMHLNPYSIDLFPKDSTGIQVADHLGVLASFGLQEK